MYFILQDGWYFKSISLHSFENSLVWYTKSKDNTSFAGAFVLANLAKLGKTVTVVTLHRFGYLSEYSLNPSLMKNKNRVSENIGEDYFHYYKRADNR